MRTRRMSSIGELRPSRQSSLTPSPGPSSGTGPLLSPARRAMLSPTSPNSSGSAGAGVAGSSVGSPAASMPQFSRRQSTGGVFDVRGGSGGGSQQGGGSGGGDSSRIMSRASSVLEAAAEATDAPPHLQRIQSLARMSVALQVRPISVSSSSSLFTISSSRDVVF